MVKGYMLKGLMVKGYMLIGSVKEKFEVKGKENWEGMPEVEKVEKRMMEFEKGWKWEIESEERGKA